MFFLADKRPSVKESLEGNSTTAVFKALGQMWSKTPESDKGKYNELAKKDRERYDEEMKVYTDNKTQGLSDGTKPVAVENGTSTDD